MVTAARSRPTAALAGRATRQTAVSAAVGEPVAGQQSLQHRDRGQRGVDRPAADGAGADGGGADGAEGAHPGRQQLVEPPAQRRGQRDERGGGLDRPGVEHDEVGVRAGELDEQREVRAAGQRDHRARRRQGQLRQHRAEALGDPAPEPLQRRLRVHADDVEPGDVAEAGHVLPGEQHGAAAGAGRADGGGRGQRRRPGPARAGEQQRAHEAPELSPRRAS